MLPDIAPGLLALAASLTGLDAAWENQDRPAVSDTTRAIVLCSFGACTPIGDEEFRLTFDGAADPGEEYTTTIVGQWRVPWRVKVESYDQDDAATAWAYLAAFRLRLKRAAAIDAINAINCSIASSGEIQDFQVPRDDRIVSIAALDVILNAKFSEDDPTKTGYIAKITGTGTLAPGAPQPYEVNLP